MSAITWAATFAEASWERCQRNVFGPTSGIAVSARDVLRLLED
jgi:hypothetical protein